MLREIYHFPDAAVSIEAEQVYERIMMLQHRLIAAVFIPLNYSGEIVRGMVGGHQIGVLRI